MPAYPKLIFRCPCIIEMIFLSGTGVNFEKRLVEYLYYTIEKELIMIH